MKTLLGVVLLWLVTPTLAAFITAPVADLSTTNAGLIVQVAAFGPKQASLDAMGAWFGTLQPAGVTVPITVESP